MGLFDKMKQKKQETEEKERIAKENYKEVEEEMEIEETFYDKLSSLINSNIDKEPLDSIYADLFIATKELMKQDFKNSIIEEIYNEIDSKEEDDDGPKPNR